MPTTSEARTIAGTGPSESKVGSEEFDAQDFRRALGHFCTGVTVVTGMADDGPVGFACQSFSALSLDPPLVLFCPGRGSRTWPILRRAGKFAVNVLGSEQRDVSTVFGRGGADKFAGVSWRPAPSGSPILDGVLSWTDCTVDAVHEAGDHYIVVGRVNALATPSSERPLLFYRGAYTGIEPAADTVVPGNGNEELDAFLTWPRYGDWF